jgi:hypothetical protein
MSQKTLYHSELSRMGLITARINSEPTESKFPNKPKWVVIELDGVERYYNCENDECELALTGRKDQWVELEAHGGREDAAIRIEVIEKPAKSADVKQNIADTKAKIAAMPDPPASPKATQDEKPRVIEAEVIEQQELKPVQGEYDKIRGYVAHAGKIFALAWEESKNAMALIPTKDAAELSAAEWLDLRLRIAQGYTIEVNRIIRKDRF